MQAPILTPGGLSVQVTPQQLVALKDLAGKLRSDTKTIGVGTSRILQRKDPVTQKLETRRQTITAVSGGFAQYETRSVDTNDLTASGKLSLEELAPLRNAVCSLAEERFDEVYSMLGSLLALQGGAEIAPDSKVVISVREAHYVAKSDSFKLSIVTAFIPQNTGAKTARVPLVSFEVVLDPTLPRPFDITRIAYGKAVANTPYLDVQSVAVP